MVANIEEQTAFGAALPAGVDAAAYRSIEGACMRTISCVESTPIEENAEKYKKHHKVFQSLYPILKEPFVEVPRPIDEAVPSPISLRNAVRNH